MLMIRRDIYANGGTFSDPVLFWYAVGVGELQKRRLDSVVSWWFMAAIHGIDRDLWQDYGIIDAGEPFPSQGDQDVYWDQCQHGSWYFLPWHRGYIWSVESLLREAIIEKGGPDDWAMPYWNYSDPNEPRARILPPAFSRKTLPDGSPNPLFVSQRYGSGVTPIQIPGDDVSLQALNATHFTNQGLLAGFGGGKTGFSHFGRETGRVEGLPHNPVHVDIGGRDFNGPGLMSDPDVAALDPVFWVHHANIDRLWSVWNKQGGVNSTDPAWLNGPLNRLFVVPERDGSEHHFMPVHMLDTQALPLEYEYDHLQADIGLAAAPITRSATRSGTQSRGGEANMTAIKPASLIGANDASVALSSGPTRSRVQLEADSAREVMRARSETLTRSTRGATRGASTPAVARQQVLLNLENIRTRQDGYVIDVYVNLPEGAKPRERQDLLAGSFALFGARKASLPDQAHAGMGVNEVFDITDIVENLVDDGDLDASEINVELVPRSDVEGADITVERISVYLQEDPQD